ncbi:MULTISPECIES: DUF2244 domain-containing protein [Ruegeria]|uniref:DUF2244 domain-containing protein n=3 Tax=Ruegeria TaxID=97050 RepID=A0A6B2NHF5_9RHOB|nr:MULTISPECIES: DUF2244 domain-containing protein [unclassified Ruegeria]MCU9840163.1 DUF2244 domain-containing protein [Ruegeria sp. WL0004]MCV2886811.1 DUF2244 domain-containing protein [Ruegeria sp. XHP0148]NDW43592.1 DUF2244 domain-containing protein [Ruegeria sp. PrR005]
MSKLVNFITATIGLGLMITFVVGLSYSISTGFAGFWGGLPFAFIAGFVILLALYNYWEEVFGKK